MSELTVATGAGWGALSRIFSFFDRRRRYFLIVGNGRTGSTWLLTSLDRLPHVLARQEIKWLPDDTFTLDPNVHSVMSKSRSATDALDEIGDRYGRNARIVGSKLIFNPFRFYGPGVFENLRNQVDSDVRLVLLKRSYLDTWLSWKVRGVYHEVNPAVAADPGNRLVDAIRKLDRPANIDLVLHVSGRPLSDAEGRPYDFSELVDDMFQLFANDMALLALVQQRGGFVLDYSEISSRFRQVAKFVGAKVSSSRVGNILSQPQTLKLPELTKHVTPITPARALSDALNQTFSNCERGLMDSRDVLQWEDESTIVVSDPSVAGALKAAGLDVGEAHVVWKIRRPLIGM